MAKIEHFQPKIVLKFTKSHPNFAKLPKFRANFAVSQLTQIAQKISRNIAFPQVKAARGLCWWQGGAHVATCDLPWPLARYFFKYFLNSFTDSIRSTLLLGLRKFAFAGSCGSGSRGVLVVRYRSHDCSLLPCSRPHCVDLQFHDPTDAPRCTNLLAASHDITRRPQNPVP